MKCVECDVCGSSYYEDGSIYVHAEAIGAVLRTLGGDITTWLEWDICEGCWQRMLEREVSERSGDE